MNCLNIELNRIIHSLTKNASTGLCYGKLEAGILTFVIPGLLLGHLSGLMDNGTKAGLLGVWMVLFTVFAARKFQQPIKVQIPPN
jgi:uncharacterized integral membrane protein